MTPTTCAACGHLPSEANQLSYLGRYEHLERCPCPCHDAADAIVAAVREWEANLDKHETPMLAAIDIAEMIAIALKAHPLPAQPGPREGVAEEK